MNELRTIREKAGISRSKLAARAGIDPGTLYKLEKAGVSPQLATAVALSRVLSELLDERIAVEDLFPDQAAEAAS